MTIHGRWKVVSVDLSEPLPEFDVEAGYEGVRAVFFWKGVALGHCELSAAQLPLGRGQLASVAARAIAQAAGDYLLTEGFRSALPGLPEPRTENSVDALTALVRMDRPVQELAGRLTAPKQERQTTVSVAVCTRERPDALARCLKSLAASSEPPAEILVIDNAPVSDATRQVLAQFPGVRYYCEPRLGLSAARNAALAVASGDIVAFTDDDVVVHPGWIDSLHRCFDDPQVMVATGLILPAELETPAQVIFERSFQFFH